MTLGEKIEAMRDEFLANALGARTNLTNKEHVEFVKKAYTYCKKIGFAKTFSSPYSNHMFLNGLEFEVLEEISPSKNYSLDELPLWKIRIPSEQCTLIAYPEEIIQACQVV